jgi:hypothetical protein
MWVLVSEVHVLQSYVLMLMHKACSICGRFALYYSTTTESLVTNDTLCNCACVPAKSMNVWVMHACTSISFLRVFRMLRSVLNISFRSTSTGFVNAAPVQWCQCIHSSSVYVKLYGQYPTNTVKCVLSMCIRWHCNCSLCFNTEGLCTCKSLIK